MISPPPQQLHRAGAQGTITAAARCLSAAHQCRRRKSRSRSRGCGDATASQCRRAQTVGRNFSPAPSASAPWPRWDAGSGPARELPSNVFCGRPPASSITFCPGARTHALGAQDGVTCRRPVHANVCARRGRPARAAGAPNLSISAPPGPPASSSQTPESRLFALESCCRRRLADGPVARYL